MNRTIAIALPLLGIGAGLAAFFAVLALLNPRETQRLIAAMKGKDKPPVVPPR